MVCELKSLENEEKAEDELTGKYIFDLNKHRDISYVPCMFTLGGLTDNNRITKGLGKPLMRYLQQSGGGRTSPLL